MVDQASPDNVAAMHQLLKRANFLRIKAETDKAKETLKWKQLYANMYANFASQPNINLVEPHDVAKTEVQILLGRIAKKEVTFKEDGSEASGCSVTVENMT